MVFTTVFLFSSSVWTLSKYLQEEPQTATCKGMGERVDRVSTNDKSEVEKPQQRCLSYFLFRLVWQASLYRNAVSLRKGGRVSLKPPDFEHRMSSLMYGQDLSICTQLTSQS